jgi:hypothetical protein
MMWRCWSILKIGHSIFPSILCLNYLRQMGVGWPGVSLGGINIYLSV